MNNILITGSKGFIGGQVTEYFQKKKVNISYLEYSKLNQNYSLSKNINLFSNINLAIHYDVILHLGWDNQNYLFSKKKKSTSNIQRTKFLFEIAKLLNIKKFIFMSTALVYGEKNHNMILKTTDKYHSPNNFYGMQKKIVENLLLDLCSQHNIQLIILRIPLVIGKKSKSLFNKYSNLIKILNGECFKYFTNKRSYISEDSLIKKLEFICNTNDFYDNKIFNLSDQPPLSLFEISQIIQKKKRESNFYEKFLGIIIGKFLLLFSKIFIKNKINNKFVLSQDTFNNSLLTKDYIDIKTKFFITY